MLDFLRITFPVSGVSTWIFIPPSFAFIVSSITSMLGISGAFVLLPFQVSVLRYTTPSVSGTNLLFNVVAVPSGVMQYFREERIIWPLTLVVATGTLPGAIIGAWIRLEYLPDPKNFKIFVGFVLLYIGLKLFADTVMGKHGANLQKTDSSGQTSKFAVSDIYFSLRKSGFKFNGKQCTFSVPGVFLLCLVVGIIGGIYGIGGGSVVVPFLVSVLNLSIYAVAGAALMGTFVTSVVGGAAYAVLAYFTSDMSMAPDWHLGALFGLGGCCGTYLGAKLQKYVPAPILKTILGLFVLLMSGKYILDFFQ